jgi:DNA-binding NarL/FixJ family response regulator
MPSPNAPISWDDRMAKIKAKHPRAYAPWSPAEEEQLVQLIKSGKTAGQIAVELQRQPSAIRSRIVRLNVGP